jgi:hypothetical protein
MTSDLCVMCGDRARRVGQTTCAACALVTVQASDQGTSLTLVTPGATITASTVTRTLSGPVVTYGVYGRTSRGRLKVAPGALRFPDDIGRVKLTKEHKRDESRGHASAIEDDGTTVRASMRVADGPEGDAALREAADRTRDGFSFDVVDAVIDGDTITSALVIAIGQVGIPAYDDMRIDTIAASTPSGRNTMTLAPDQAALLIELQSKDKDSLTDEEKETLKALQALAAAPAIAAPEPAAPAAPAPVAAAAVPAEQPVQASQTGQQVAASIPAVPVGVPAPGTSSTTTSPQGGAFGQFCYDMAQALAPGNQNKLADVTAALQDVTYSAHSGNIQQPDWSGELWSGLEYQPEFLDLFTEGTLTSLKGTGWRFTSKLEIQDYAGDKAEIPTDNITTETQDWTGARMAVGVDIDRAFFDFPTAGFIESLFQQVRESWKIKLDAKVRAYTLAQAVAAAEDEFAGVPVVIGAQETLLKAAAIAVRSLKRRRVGAATWVLVSDEDMFTLIDTRMDDLLAYLKLFNIDPEQFRSSSQLAAGTVYAGVKPAAKVRTMPGSPIRVDAQRLTHGGVDEAFFGYWAIEEQHTRGIAKATFTAPA